MFRVKYRAKCIARYKVSCSVSTLKSHFLVIVACFLLLACSDNVPEFDQREAKPGGDMTLKRLSTRSYIYPGAGVTSMQKLNFWTGFSLFRDPWVIAPSSTRGRDGLGPLFNTRACITCHDSGSRGLMTDVEDKVSSALVIKLGTIDDNENLEQASSLATSNIDPNYGDQIQPRALLVKYKNLTETLKGEAVVKLSYQKMTGKFSDGTDYELMKPSYQLAQLGYGDLAPQIGLSPRFSPNIFGMGLLDAISNDDLIAHEDIFDSDNNGISAKYNRVVNIQTGATELGRFGLKAKHPNLRQQIAAAFRNDIGITSSLFRNESCTNEQINCKQAAILGAHPNGIKGDSQSTLEINDKLLSLVVSFNRFLGVPPARNLDNAKTLEGRKTFYQLGCQHCHTPSYQTDENYPVTELAQQTIWPYTDLALHDMGPALADNVIEDDANGQEWRTPPLWGIGMQRKVIGQQRFLHDGRARSIEEAILWHGGEAAYSQDKFLKLNKNERQALVQFLRSI